MPYPLPHSPDQYTLVSSGQTLYQAAPLETNTLLLQRFTAEIVGNSGETQCLEEAEQQAEESVDVPPPLQIVISVPFCLFSLYLYPLLSQTSLFSLSSFPLASPPSLLSLLINSLSSKDKDFKFHSVSLLSEMSLACGSSALPSPCYLTILVKMNSNK